MSLRILLAALFLSGCVHQEPARQKPDINLPRQWPHSSTKIEMHANLDLPDLLWWKHYQQPQLNEAIQRALKENNNLQIASAHVEYSEALLKQIKLNWLPGLTLLTGASQMPYLGNPGLFIAVLPSYALNIFQQIKQQKSATHQLAASRYARDSVRLVVTSRVTSSYFTLLAQNEMADIQETLLTRQKQLLHLYQRKFNTGISAKDKVVELQGQVLQTEAQLAVTRHNITLSENALHLLMNENPGRFSIKKRFSQLKTNSIIPGAFPVTVINNRPDVREATALLRVANANIGAATSTLLPSIKLDAFLGKGSSIGNASLGEGLISAPLLNFPAFGLIDASKAQYHAQTSAWMEIVKQALRDVDNDLSAFSAFGKQLDRDLGAVQQLQQKCDLVSSRYKHGLSSEITTLHCQIELSQARLRVNQDKLAKMLSIVMLYQDMGGGYGGT